MGYKLKRILIYPDGVTEKQVYPVWKPGANTVLYYPFKDDQLDKVGGSSISITGTNETLGYTFNSNNTMNITNAPTTCRFVSVWCKYNSSNGSYVKSPSTYYGQINYSFSHASSDYNRTFNLQTGASTFAHSTSQSTSTGNWYHLAMGYDGSKVRAYLNGSKVWEATVSCYNPGTMLLGQQINETLSDLIGENRVRTTDEVLEYYNQTKSKYGL